ncbi:MAG: AMP-binding protein [Gemmatimonas sp.]
MTMTAAVGETGVHAFSDSSLVPLVRQFLVRAALAPEALAFAAYPAGGGARIEMTWGAWASASRAIAVQLLQAGIAHGDRVAVLAGNCALWPISDLAIHMVGAIGVGVYPTSTQAQVESLLNDSGATLALVGGAAHGQTMRAARRSIGRSFPIITDQSDAAPSQDGAIAGDAWWTDWLREGAETFTAHASVRAELEARIAAVTLEDLAALIYTSGSTGAPKGACISHRYLSASAASLEQVLALSSDDRAVSFLPFSHAAERVFGQCTRIVSGMATALIEDPADLFAVAREFEPTILGGLPRIFERLYEAAEVARQEGRNPREAIADRIGPRCRLATSGGATLPTEIAQGLADLGLLILGAYGQTEHLCVAMNRPTQFRFDAVGAPMPGTTIRVADDGELLVASSALTFSGYWRDAAATRNAFTADGAWLRTGDRGALDADGMLRITGRVKELIALSTGRKIAPLPIEAALVSSPFVAHAVCQGEGRKYLTALLSVRRSVIEAWARAEGVVAPWPSLIEHPRVQALLDEAVNRVNADLARTDQIQRFAVTADDFTIEGGELTPTHKLVRRVIDTRYADTIEALYGAPNA